MQASATTVLAAGAVLAAALAALPHRTQAQLDDPAHPGRYALELLDASGRTLPTFHHRGRTFVLGTLGERYQLRVRNGSSERVEVVASVDGRDVLDGRTASLAKRGYLVPAHGEVVIDGFRLDASAVAAFRFSSVPRSYAALTGDARDVGVVGAAIFRERAGPPAVVQAPPARPGEGRSDAEAAPAKAGAPSAPAPEAQASARRRAEGSERPGLGTEFGERRSSPVQEVAFERAEGRPAAVLTSRYDDRAGLAALGVDVDGRWARREEAWRRERAEPFRGSPGFAEPPPGWRP